MRRVFQLALMVGMAAFSRAQAASTEPTKFITPHGTNIPLLWGDYVSSQLKTYHSYFIEVTPGTTKLQVDLFDADVGAGTAAEGPLGRDVLNTTTNPTNAWNTQATYALFDPGGNQVATLTCSATVAANCPDNAWTTLYTSPGIPPNGHWEFRITMNNGKDINAVGLRAHDGDATGGGRELNVYVDNIMPMGTPPPVTNGPLTSRTYNVYPYVTRGCSAKENDFDWDLAGSLTLATRTNSFAQSFGTMSADQAWLNHTVTGWTSDNVATDYGIWRASLTINTGPAYLTYPNYGSFYFAADNSTNAAPGANPSNTPTGSGYRTYLPTDAAGIPLKPHVDQQQLWVSGPNPPVANQTTVMKISIRVINPTAGPIDFNTSNLVTAYIPGGVVTAVGPTGTTASQGTVTGQPGAGGAGTISWNPGTVASGSTATLTYRINFKPAKATGKTPTTGTVAANGTQAVFLDETQSATQQNRAKVTFGPLCPLAITPGVITRVLFDGATAERRGTGAVVQWTTRAEDDTVGFHVWRGASAATAQRVTPTLLRALAEAPLGGQYRWVDRTPTGEPYWIEEVERSGGANRHGPLALTGSPTRNLLPPWVFDRTPNSGQDRVPAPVPGATTPPGTGPGIVMGLARSGLYALSTPTIAAHLGVSGVQAQQLLAAGRLELWKDGHAVAWRASPAHDALTFWADAHPGLYADVDTIQLRPGEGAQFRATHDAPAGATVADAWHTLDREEDHLVATAAAPDPGSDYWFWNYLAPGDPTNGTLTFPSTIDHLVAGTGARVAVRLHGATRTAHAVKVRVNGVLLGQTTFDGITRDETVFDVPAGTLVDGANDVSLQALDAAGDGLSIVYVDGFALTWRRALVEPSGGLDFVADASGQVDVPVLAAPTAQAWDISEPFAPVALLGATPGPASLRFPVTAGHRYAVASTSLAPTWSRPAALAIPGRATALVVIAPRAFHAQAERLVQARGAQGLSARVVDLEDVGDVYGAGLATPAALKAFIDGAWRHGTPRLQYVVLAGSGTYDYRDRLGLGGALIPPPLVRTSRGLYSSDSSLGDVDGQDGVPEVAIGRLPARTEADLSVLLDKLLAYDATPDADWARAALMVADGVDPVEDFTGDAQTLAGALPARMHPELLTLATTDVATARARMSTWFTTGGGFLAFLGHGALDRFSAQSLFTSADATALTTATGQNPVAMALTCGVNRFETPRTRSLGEALVLARGGALAFFAPSSPSVHPQAMQMGQAFVTALDQPGVRLGDAMRAALQGRDVTPELSTYTLLGDPSLMIKGTPPKPPEPVDAGVVDAGVEPGPDAGITPDGGAEPVEPVDAGPTTVPAQGEVLGFGGGGCASVPATLPLLALVLLGATRRSRARRSGPSAPR